MGGSAVTTHNHPSLVLASASAARTRLLRDAGIDHVCDPADINEAALKQKWTGDAEGLALELACLKALEVTRRHGGAMVIGADQVLALDAKIFDKPGHVDRVRAQLESLRGKTHTLISAVAIARDGEVLWSNADQVHLTMRHFSDAFLDDYVKQVGADVAGSVGAYHLEGLGAQLFAKVDGDYFTVLGLPLIALMQELRDRGVLKK